MLSAEIGVYKSIKACVKFMLGAHSEYPYHFWVKDCALQNKETYHSSALVLTPTS